MFTIRGKALLEDDVSILQFLQSQIEEQLGISLFGRFIVTDSNIQICCPVHNNGQEKRPSCGISRVDKIINGKKIPAGTVHCFTCGYTATLPEMISYIYGYDDSGAYGTKWLIKNFLSIDIEDRKPLDLKLSRNSNHSEQQYVPEKQLDRYRYYHDYMFKRGLTEELIEKYDIGYDPKFKLKKNENTFPCITFPVRDMQGRTLFIARRAIHFKLYHYPENVFKPLYGVYELDYSQDTLYVCESIINAITAVKYGVTAIALLGTGTSEQFNLIKKLPFRKIVAAFDGDEAGDKGAKRLIKIIDNKLVKSLVVPRGKDINDLSEQEFKNCPEIFLSKKY